MILNDTKFARHQVIIAKKSRPSTS